MDKIRQSFRRKKNKHKQQTENNFDVQNVFDDDLEPRPISRIQKIRQSLRTLKKKKKHNKDTELPVDEDLEAENKFTLDANEEENEVDDEGDDEKDEGFSVKEEIEDEPLDKKSRFRFSFRKKKNREKEDATAASKDVTDKKSKKKKKKGSGKWDSDEERVRSNHCEFKINYLGFLEVQESRGMEVCEAAIKNLLNSKKKPSKGKLHVTGDGLRVVDKKGGMLVDQVIEKVSFCAPDRNHHHGFAYISRDGTSRRWLCHGFMARRDSGERLSHAVGVAFAVCLENKQAREREGVTATYDEEEGTFTRFGSFRVGTITERLQNPQEFKESVQKNEVGAVDNPFAIARPKPGDIRSSMRGIGEIRGASPFKRGGPDYSSLRVNELPSNISRKEKSRVSLILEENFENEETKNEINEMILAMGKAKIEEQKMEEDMLTSISSHYSENSTTPAMMTPSTSFPPIGVTVTNNNVSNNNIADLSDKAPDNNESSVVVKDKSEPVNPWDLVPDQTKIKHHSRSNSKHENVKFDGNGKLENGEANQGDKWLASLTNKISALEETPTRGWSDSLTNKAASDDALDNEWAALANRNEVKPASTNNNPFIAFV